MAAPTVYNYDSTTGIYTGSTPAMQSPLDHPGVWLYPANSTLIAPPTTGPGQAAYFSVNLGKWGLSSVTPSSNSLNPTASPPVGVPSCMLWQLQAVLTPDQWTTILATVASLNNPALTAFAAHGSNFIPANSTTLLSLGAAIGLTPEQVTAIVTQASAVTIP